MKSRRHIVHVGQTGQYEKTDPDYVDKRMAQLAKDYFACPKEWRQTFLNGLSKADYEAVMERISRKA